MYFIASGLCFAQKTEKHISKLQEIQKQIDLRNRELEEYIGKVEDLKAQMRSIKRESEEEKKRKKMLEESLKKTSGNISGLREKYSALKEAYMRILFEMTMDSSKMYIESFSMTDYYGKDTIVKSITLRNIILGKSAIAKSVNKKSATTDVEVKKLISKKQSMDEEKRRVLDRLRQREKKLTITKREMENDQKKLKALQSEIVRLKNSAAELSGLIKKLKKQSPYKDPKLTYIPIEKYSLPWPVDGMIISRFGKEYVPQLKTWLIRDGIRIKAQLRTPAKSVMNGTVVYTGPFRNYGNIVVIGNEENVFTTYGMLGSISVNSGDKVNAGSIVGYVGDDVQAIKDDENLHSALYFEIRIGSDAVDPQLYLKK